MKFYHEYHAQAKQKLRKMRRARKAPNTKIGNEQEYQLWRWLWRYMGLS